MNVRKLCVGNVNVLVTESNNKNCEIRDFSQEEPKEKALLVSDSAAEEEEENIKANISEGKTLLH